MTAVQKLPATGPDARKAATVPPPFPDFAARVAAIYRARRLREKYLPGDLFGEPAWDILLDLYVSAAMNRTTSVSSVCLAAHVPQTTALRWITMLERRGLVVRSGDPTDNRRKLLQLSVSGYDLMTRFLFAEWRETAA